MNSADNNNIASQLKRLPKKQETKTLKTAVSATDLRKIYAQGIQRSGRNLLKKSGNPHLKLHISKSPTTKQGQQKGKVSVGNPERQLKYPSSKLAYKQQIIKLAREKEIIQSAYFELTHKYFGALSQIKEIKQKSDIQKTLLKQQIEQLREMVNKKSSKQIHHLFQVPTKGLPPSQSKVIQEIDEAYQVSNIYLSLPSQVGRKTSQSNLSLQLHSNQGSNIQMPKTYLLSQIRR